ncbi:MAG: alpha/beta hydrolase [Gaiellaceae bacterium]
MSLQALERPAAGEPQGLLVLMHGRGADERDLLRLLDVLDPERRLLGVTPRGPLSLPPGGAHWFRLRQIGVPEPESFRATYAELAAWLDGLGFPAERTILGGFSQGAVMSYALGLGRGRPRPAAIVALSGYLPEVEGWQPDLEQPLPRVAIGHGTFDDVISVQRARGARELLERSGAEVLYRESPMPHTIDPSFLTEVVEWLQLSAVGSERATPG